MASPDSTLTTDKDKDRIGWKVWRDAQRAAKGLILWACNGIYSAATRSNNDGTTTELTRPAITITDSKTGAILNIPAMATIDNAVTDGTVICLLLPLTNPNKVLFHTTAGQKYHTLNAADVNPGNPIVMS
jgi:hypothetical protein